MKDLLTSPRIEEMKRKRRVRRMRLSILIFILIAVLIGALGYFSGKGRVTIGRITVTGTRIINVSDVESRVRGGLSGKYLYLFAKANTFIYPRRHIYDDLLIQSPRIEKLSIYRDDWNTIHIDIAERSGSSLYCGGSVPLSESDKGENCYFINNDGYIFDKAPYFSGNIYFKYYKELPDSASSPLGEYMLPQERFHELVRFTDGITALGFEPIYLVLGSAGDNTLYLDHKTGHTSPVIMWKQENDLSDILDNLSVSMAKPEFANEINSKYTTLLYIDLRFKNKVLYKFN